ncbi:ROK family protein [uncultured Paenibacillus sp.]|uniref:ROK family protein n=1 Tax=uncultured Paenibacillus sp. TaxID=227322 RepID=UPI0028D2567E|nr:ROK family protein [uncultured Paenibacillus sp.]
MTAAGEGANAQGADGMYVGIDVGGSAIKGGLVTRRGELILEDARRTPVEAGRAGIVEAIADLAVTLIDSSRSPVIGVGIGSAGAIDPDTGSVSRATDNLPGWTGTPLAELLAERTGLPVKVDNDVHAAALGEAWTGAAKTYDSFVFVALGTGVGGALTSRGRIIHGFRGTAGEIGHMLIKPDGLLCNCGQRGCWEQYTSGTALNRMAKEIEGFWDSHLLFKRFAEGDSRAVEAVDSFVKDLATGLVSLQNVFGPEAIIIGGGLAQSSILWWESLEHRLKEMTTLPVTIIAAKLGNRAGVIGAARLAKGI